MAETWITEVKKDLLQLEGFQRVASFNRVNYNCGGVCIFVKEGIKVIERTDIAELTTEYVFETCAVEIPKLNIILVLIYWPERNRQAELFFRSLEKLLHIVTLQNSNKKIIIGGDFNIDVLVPDNLTNTLNNLMKSYNFRQLIKEPTRITPTSATCIDLLFVNYEDNSLHTKGVEYGLSDHKGILINIHNTKRERENWYTKKRH